MSGSFSLKVATVATAPFGQHQPSSHYRSGEELAVVVAASVVVDMCVDGSQQQPGVGHQTLALLSNLDPFWLWLI